MVCFQSVILGDSGVGDGQHEERQQRNAGENSAASERARPGNAAHLPAMTSEHVGVGVFTATGFSAGVCSLVLSYFFSIFIKTTKL